MNQLENISTCIHMYISKWHLRSRGWENRAVEANKSASNLSSSCISSCTEATSVRMYKIDDASVV